MLTIAGLNFEGGFPLYATNFNEVAGVYVIYVYSHPNYIILDVGETGQLSTRMASHERKPDWLRHAGSNIIHVAVFREGDQMRRLAIEAQLRNTLNPLCGDR